MIMSGYRTLKAMQEIADLPGARAFMQVLAANGINHFECRDPNNNQLIECCSFDRMFEELETAINRRSK